MKKSIMAVTLACTCACMMGLVGCGSSGNTNNANTANNSTNAAVASNTNTTAGSATSNGSTSGSTGNTGSATTGSSSTSDVATANDAIQKATNSGVTTKSADEMQAMMDNTLNIGMTLSDVRSAMGCEGTSMGDGYSANTYAWYSADKSKAIIATFNGQDASSTLTSCEISFD